MSSLKHAIVALLLLGVSYGVYQAITLPEASLVGRESLETEGLVIETGTSIGLRASDSTPSAPASAPSIVTTPKISSSLPSSSPSFGEFAKVPQHGQPSDQPWASQSWSANGSATRGPTQSDSKAAEVPVNSPRLHDGMPAAATSELRGPPSTLASDSNLSLAGGGSSGMSNSVALTGGLSAAAPLPPFSTVFQDAQQLVRQGEFREALRRLTPYVRQTNLSSEEKKTLYDWVDALALKVIYSPEHLWYPAHTTSPGETLDSLAAEWKVPSQLIYYINRAQIGSGELTPGLSLKKVSGPFHGEMSTSGNELTLFVDNFYAGRFRIVEPIRGALTPGTYTVDKKDIGGHPVGTYFIGTNHPALYFHAPGFGQSSGVVFSAEDARDLFGILSLGSQITIR